MSLSAHIAVRASRRLEVVAAWMAIGGVFVVAFTAAHRWPAGGISIGVLATVAAAAIVGLRLRAYRAASSCILSVSDRAEIAVYRDLESGDDESWRLDDSTMMWPGFSVIGLRREGDAVHGGRSMRLAVFDAELAAPDRRSLHRFLLWSLRGGREEEASARGSASR